MARGIPTINGTADDDLIYGDDPKGRPAAQIINGLAGNDTIYGDVETLAKKTIGAGDQLFGGDGDDYLYGDAATMSGSAHGGADTLSGGAGDDALYGDAYTLVGSALGGNDSLTGGEGSNAMFGDADSLNDNAVGGNDTLSGGAGVNSLYGDADRQYDATRGGNDVLVADDQGEGWSNTLVGDSYDVWDTASGGNDTLTATSSGPFGTTELLGDAIQLYGHGGNDVLTWHASNISQSDAYLAGDAYYMRAGGEDTLAAVGGDDTLTATGSAPATLYGDALEMEGRGGSDVLNGGDGNDHLFGDAQLYYAGSTGGADTLNGGGGNDTLSGGMNDDRFVFTPGSGFDVITDFNQANASVGDTTPEHDVIDVSACWTNWTDISSRITLIDTDANGEADSSLVGVDLSNSFVVKGVMSLTESDFLF